MCPIPETTSLGRPSETLADLGPAPRRAGADRRRLAILLAIAIVATAVAFALEGPGAPITPLTRLDPDVAHAISARYAALPDPAPLAPLAADAPTGDGRWRGAGRTDHGRTVVYLTHLHLPDEPGVMAGVAWMDARRLVARQYSGTISPGGSGWHLTAPITPEAAQSLVVAFNGGFKPKDMHGGYYAEGRDEIPLVDGAASLVIYTDGTIDVGEWGRDFTMSTAISSVRQNLVLLVDGGKVAPGVTATDIHRWGAALNRVADTWRSGIGVTADGAIVYAYGPMNVLDLARVLLDAGSVRAMTLDMNPAWTIFAVYQPATPDGEASPANGVGLLRDTVHGPDSFFNPAYQRDFITLSAR